MWDILIRRQGRKKNCKTVGWRCLRKQVNLWGSEALDIDFELCFQNPFFSLFKQTQTF